MNGLYLSQFHSPPKNATLFLKNPKTQTRPQQNSKKQWQKPTKRRQLTTNCNISPDLNFLPFLELRITSGREPLSKAPLSSPPKNATLCLKSPKIQARPQQNSKKQWQKPTKRHQLTTNCNISPFKLPAFLEPRITSGRETLSKPPSILLLKNATLCLKNQKLKSTLKKILKNNDKKFTVKFPVENEWSELNNLKIFSHFRSDLYIHLIY